MEPLIVKYDYDKFEITIPVQVRPAPNSDSEPLVFTPPVAIPKCQEQKWELQWELDGLSKELVRLSGVEKKGDAMPLLELETLKVDGYCCRVRVTCTATEANCAPVELFFLPKNHSVNNGEIFSHDPTIAVTLDPVDGCSYSVSKADAVLALKD